MGRRERISKEYPNQPFHFADGYDGAIIGVDEHQKRIIYSKGRMLEVLMKGGMEIDKAVEYLDTVVCANGEQSGFPLPIWCNDYMLPK